MHFQDHVRENPFIPLLITIVLFGLIIYGLYEKKSRKEREASVNEEAQFQLRDRKAGIVPDSYTTDAEAVHDKCAAAEKQYGLTFTAAYEIQSDGPETDVACLTEEDGIPYIVTSGRTGDRVRYRKRALRMYRNHEVAGDPP